MPTLTPNSYYYLQGALDKAAVLDLRLNAGTLTTLGRTYKIKGSGYADWIVAYAGISIDFSDTGAGVDKLYLDGNFTDYVVSTESSSAGNILVLTRGSSVYKISANTEDKVVFQNGWATTEALRTSTATLSTTETFISRETGVTYATAANGVYSRLVMSEPGTAIVNGGEPLLTIVGSGGVDKIYIREGASADLRGLGQSQDQIYFTGKWAEYTKSVTAAGITFTRSIVSGATTVQERVVVAAEAGSNDDRLYFADGSISSNIARQSLTTNLLVTLARAGGTSGYASDTRTPLELVNAVVTGISTDTGLSDLTGYNTDKLTKTASQTISGTFIGSLQSTDRIQLRVGSSGVWADATTIQSSSTSGTFSLAGAMLAEGLNTIQVRVLSAAGLSRAGTSLGGVILDTNIPGDSPNALLTVSSGDSYVNANEASIDLFVEDLSDYNIGDRVRLRIDGADVGSEVQITSAMRRNGYTFTVTKASLGAEGSHSITLYSRDTAGNAHESPVIAVIKDTITPVTSFAISTVASDGTTSLGDLIKDAYLSNAEDNVLLCVTLTSGTVASGDRLRLRVESAVAGEYVDVGDWVTLTSTHVLNGVVYFNLNKARLKQVSPSEGAKNFKLYAVDAAGNSSITSTPVVITLDTIAPSVNVGLSSTQADGTAWGSVAANDAIVTLGETSFLLKLQGGVKTDGTIDPDTGFKVGDKLILQHYVQNSTTSLWEWVTHTQASGATTEIIVNADQAAANTVYFAVEREGLPIGQNRFRFAVNDLAGNTTGVFGVTAEVSITHVTNFQISSALITGGMLTNLDVNGEIVLEATAAGGNIPTDIIANLGGTITITNLANSSGKAGFLGEVGANTQVIKVTDSRYVTIVGNKIYIRPPFDLDFANQYQITISDAAFSGKIAGADTDSREMVAGDGINFSTVGVGADKSHAEQGQIFHELADGTMELVNGKKWFSIENMGDPFAPANIDLAGGDYGVVLKDANAGGPGARLTGPTYVSLSNLGLGDLIYLDDQNNDPGKLNQKDSISIFDVLDENFAPSSDKYFTFDGGGEIRFVAGGTAISLTRENILNLINISNAKSMVTPVTGVERVDAAEYSKYQLKASASDATLFSSYEAVGDLVKIGANTESMTIRVKAAGGYKEGDKAQLLYFINGAYALLAEAVATAGATFCDVVVSQATLASAFGALSASERKSIMLRTSITGGGTGIYGATFIGAEELELNYDTVAPTPALVLDDGSYYTYALPSGYSTDLTLTELETHVQFLLRSSSDSTDGFGINEFYSVGLYRADGTFIKWLEQDVLTQTILAANDSGLPANLLRISVAKADLELGTNYIKVTVRDAAGLEGVSSAVTVVKQALTTVAGDVFEGPILAGNDLKIIAFDKNGNVLASDESLVATAGTADYSLKIPQNYTGAVRFVVSSKGTAVNDFYDENTGSYNLSGNLTSVVWVSGSSTTVAETSISAHVTTLTDIAARKFISLEGLTQDEVNNVNGAVKAFFLGGLASEVYPDVMPTVDGSGVSKTSTANLYGQVLASISALMQKNSWTLERAQQELADSLTIDSATGVCTPTVGSVAAEVMVLAKLHFNRQNAGVLANPTMANLVTQADLALLGLAGYENLSATRKTELLTWMNNSGTALSNLDTLTELQTKASQIRATGIIDDYKGGTSNIEPTVEDFSTALYSAVNADNLVAVLQKLRDGTSGATSALRISAGVTAQSAALTKIQDYADSATNSVPTVGDYITAGISGVTQYNVYAANALVEAKTKLEVNTKSLIQDLITGTNGAIDKHELALEVVKFYISGPESNAAPTANTYRDMGRPAIDTDDKVAAANTFLSYAKSAWVNINNLTAADLIAKFDAYDAAMTAISNYGDAGYTAASAAPTIAQYEAALVASVGTITEQYLPAINSAVSHLSKASTDRVDELRSIVATYIKILQLANPTTTSVGPSLSEYALLNVGLSNSVVSAGAKAALLNEIIGHFNDGTVDAAISRVNSIAKLEALVGAINAIYATAAGATDATSLTLEQAQIIGLTVADQAALNTIKALIVKTNDSGSEIDTWAELYKFFVNTPSTGSITVGAGTGLSGAPKQGDTLTATDSVLDTDGKTTIGYQWQERLLDTDTWVDIASATSTSLTLNEARVGKKLRLKMSYVDNYERIGEIFSASTVAVENVNDAPSGGQVTITRAAVTPGSAITQGDTLTANVASDLADADGLSSPVGFTYIWESAATSAGAYTAITGATSSTYVIEPSQVGRYIRVKVGYTDSKGTAEELAASSSTAAVSNLNDAPTGQVIITKVARSSGVVCVGDELLADAGAVQDNDGLPAAFNYQWLADGSEISGATQNKFTVTSAQLGKVISVRINYVDNQNTAETLTSASTTAVIQDTIAPSNIDVNADMSNVQTIWDAGIYNRTLVQKQQLFPKVAASTDGDIKKLSVRISGVDFGVDQLWVGEGASANLDLSSTSQRKTAIAVIGVDGNTLLTVDIVYTYTAGTPAQGVIEFVKNSGGLFTAAELLNLEKALKFSTISVADGLREFVISHIDNSGNASGSGTASILIDNAAPILDANGAASGIDLTRPLSINTALNIADELNATLQDSGRIKSLTVSINSSSSTETLSQEVLRFAGSAAKFFLDGSNVTNSVTINIGGSFWGVSYAQGGFTFTAQTAIPGSTVSYVSSATGATPLAAQALLRALRYSTPNSPTADRIFTVTATDFTDHQSLPINLVLTSDRLAPIVDLSGSGSGTSGGRAMQTPAPSSLAASGIGLNASATLSDASYIARVNIKIAGVLNGADEKLLIGTTELSLDGVNLPSSVTLGGVAWAIAYDASKGVITFGAPNLVIGVPASAAQDLLRALTYKNTASTLKDGLRTFNVYAEDIYGNITLSDAAQSSVLVGSSNPGRAPAISPAPTPVLLADNTGTDYVTTGGITLYDKNKDGKLGDVFDIIFTEAVKVSLIESTNNWSGKQTSASTTNITANNLFGTGWTISALDPVVIGGVSYAARYRIIMGANPQLAENYVLRIAADKVEDPQSNKAGLTTEFVEFTMRDIDAPTQLIPPVAIGVDNRISFVERRDGVTVNYGSIQSGDSLYIYRDGVFVKSVTPSNTSASFTLTGAELGADGVHSFTVKAYDGRGNFSKSSVSKSVTVDTVLEQGIKSAAKVSASGSTPSPNDEIVLNFREAIMISPGSLPSDFGGSPTLTAINPDQGGYTNTWKVKLGSSPANNLLTTDLVIAGAQDLAGNTGNLTFRLPSDLYAMPSSISIATVALDNVISSAEKNVAQSIRINVGSMAIGDTVELYMDGVFIGSKVANNTDVNNNYVAINVAANGWGADGERVLSASVKRGGNGTVLNTAAGKHVFVNANLAHWAAKDVLWFNTDTLEMNAAGTGVDNWSASTQGTIFSASGTTQAVTANATNSTNHRIIQMGGRQVLYSGAVASTGAGFVIPANNNIVSTSASLPSYSLFMVAQYATIAAPQMWPALGGVGDYSGNAIPRSIMFGRQDTNDFYYNFSGAGSIQLTAAIAPGAFSSYGLQHQMEGSNEIARAWRNGERYTTNIPNPDTNLTFASRLGIIGGFNAAWYGYIGDAIYVFRQMSLNESMEIQLYNSIKFNAEGRLVTRLVGNAYDLSVSTSAFQLIDDRIDLTDASSDDLITTAGSDYVMSGQGKDRILIKDLAFRLVDAGMGVDTLALHSSYEGSSNIVLADYVSNARGNSATDTMANTRVNSNGYHMLMGIEVMDLSTNVSSQVLTVGANDVKQLSETGQLFIRLGANDRLNVSGFTGSAQYGYYTNTESDGSTSYYQRKWTTTIGGDTIALYARDGLDAPDASSIDLDVRVVTINFDQLLAGTTLSSEWSVSAIGGSTLTVSSVIVKGSQVVLTLDSAPSSALSITYGGSGLVSGITGEGIRHTRFIYSADEVNIAADTLNYSTSQGLVIFGGSGDMITGSDRDLANNKDGNDLISLSGTIEASTTVAGGTGADTFAFERYFNGALVEVTDFDRSQGDHIDLRGLLAGKSVTDFSRFIRISQDATNAILDIDISGAGQFDVNPTAHIKFLGAADDLFGAGNSVANLIDQRVLCV